MCIFNDPISKVKKTRILVFQGNNGRQYTVYENTVESIDNGTQQNAMILPAPLLDKEGHNVELIDLSGEANEGFFDKLNTCFPSIDKGRSKSSVSRGYLEVKAVGCYNVSVARNLEDLRRIDPSVFKVSPNIDQVLSEHYPINFAFVICCFDPSKNIAPHPLGYSHDLLGTSLFVPTRHEHGDKSELAHFDHNIFSLNTKGENCGKTAAEILKDFVSNQRHYIKPENSVFEVLSASPLSDVLPPIENFRRLDLVGNRVNEDCYLDFINKPVQVSPSQVQEEMQKLEKRNQDTCCIL